MFDKLSKKLQQTDPYFVKKTFDGIELLSLQYLSESTVFRVKTMSN